MSHSQRAVKQRFYAVVCLSLPAGVGGGGANGQCLFWWLALSPSGGARTAQRAGGQSNRGFVFGRLQIGQMRGVGQRNFMNVAVSLTSSVNAWEVWVGGGEAGHPQIGLSRSGLVCEGTFVL